MITINASFPGISNDTMEEHPAITLTSNIRDSLDGITKRNISSTLFITEPGPFLYQSSADPRSSYGTLARQDNIWQVQLKAQNLTFNGSIQNLGANGSIQNNAYNVSFNWTLPDYFLIAEATESYYTATYTASGTAVIATSTVQLIYDNITDTAKHYNRIIVALNSSNLPDMEEETIGISLTAAGHDNEGNLITSAGESTILNTSFTIQFSCYYQSDGICVESCNDADSDCIVCNDGVKEGSEVCDTYDFGDKSCSTYGFNTGSLSCASDCLSIITSGCSTTETTDNPQNPGGGGSSGGASSSATVRPTAASITQKEKLFQTSAVYELVRGKGENFTLTVENSFDGPFEDVEVSLTGFLAQYMDINPKGKSSIDVNESKDFTISIAAPEYFTNGRYDLVFIIEGTVNLSKDFGQNTVYRYSPIKETRTITLYIQEISRDEADELIAEAYVLIQAMRDAGLNTANLEEWASLLEGYLDDHDYSTIKSIVGQIEDVKNMAFDAQSIIEEVKRMIASAQGNGLTTVETERILLLAQAALDRGDYALALERANDAKVTAAIEIAGKFNLAAFVRNNWKGILAALAVLCIALYLLLLSLRYFLIKERIRFLTKEIDVVTDLIKETQRECFEGNRLGIDEYKDAIYQYEMRLNRLFNNITELQTKRTHMVSLWHAEEHRLNAEKEQIIQNIREMQGLYINEHKVEMHTYDNRMRSYNERLTEIEERLATIEAERKMKHA